MVDSRMVASVVAVWRYPVKSMQGEEVGASAVTPLGLLGDRAYALADLDGAGVASAKNPRKWPGLFQFRATFVTPSAAGAEVPAVRITLPDGTVVGSGQADTDRVLSQALARRVALRRPAGATVLEEYWPDLEGLAHRDTVTQEAMPAGTFFDLAPVHLLSTATLRRLAELHPRGNFDVRRFRPNFLLDLAGEGQDERSWIGKTLTLGEEVRLRVTGPCGRCVMTTLAQPGLEADPEVLRTAVKHLGGEVGIYAEVLAGGTARHGDAVRVEG
jgi:uncharacterized protein YcbX